MSSGKKTSLTHIQLTNKTVQIIMLEEMRQNIPTKWVWIGNMKTVSGLKKSQTIAVKVVNFWKIEK